MKINDLHIVGSDKLIMSLIKDEAYLFSKYKIDLPDPWPWAIENEVIDGSIYQEQVKWLRDMYDQMHREN
tara:strand:- start:18 stop:227 length:210 start_codon:yes stop_codon:yes gene_type:complete